jgi:CRP-like cAMP-binding protein
MDSDRYAALERLFRRIEMRDDLSAEERGALHDASTDLRTFPAGATIVEHGARPQSSTLLVSGFASRFNYTEEGGRQISAVHVSGDFVDLHSLPLKRMDHGIGALSDCTVLIFPHAGLIQITERLPHLARLLWMLTMLDAAIHRRWLVSMGRTPASSQMAHLLCELYLRLEAVGEAAASRMHLPFTQSEIADVLGISAVHANRVLQDLRGRGLVIWEGRQVHLPDWPALAAEGQFSDEFLYREKMPR